MGSLGGRFGGGGVAAVGGRQFLDKVYGGWKNLHLFYVTEHVLLAHEICDEQSTHFTWGSAARTGESGHYFYEPRGLRQDLPGVRVLRLRTLCLGRTRGLHVWAATSP